MGRIGVQVTVPRVEVYSYNSLESDVRLLLPTRPQMVVFLISRHEDKRLYSQIKQTTTTVCPMPSQVVKIPIPPQRASTILTKIAMQIQAKIGGQLWKISLNDSVPAFGKYVMIVGIDVFHDTVEKTKSVLGFCATVHPNFSKYYGTTAMHESGQEIATAIGTLLLEALAVFKEKAKRLPEAIIVFRDGVSESQTVAVQDVEIRSVLQACGSLQEGEETYNPNLIYTLVVKRIGQKFFVEDKSGAAVMFSNPPPGTIITGPLLPSPGDFYLISQSVSQGVATPTLYRTIYASHPNDFPLQELAQLAYNLCHMYYNWTGTIKVPAPCMMAHKIAYLVGKNVHRKMAMEMNMTQSYL